MVLMMFSCLFVDFKFVLKCIKYVIEHSKWIVIFSLMMTTLCLFCLTTLIIYGSQVSDLSFFNL